MYKYQPPTKMFHLPVSPSYSGWTTSITHHEAIYFPSFITSDSIFDKPFHYLPNIISNSPDNDQLKALDIAADSTTTSDQTVIKEEEEKKTSTTTKKKKCSDRHSKIAVKNRLRHRRTRLSIDVARQLFELQDMLEFERASKAVEWLLVHARPHIAKLRRDRRVGDESEISEDSKDNDNDGNDNDKMNKNKINDNKKATMKKKHRTGSSTRSRKGAAYYSSAAAKQIRELARKRARERTLLKRSSTQVISASSSWVSSESSRGFSEKTQLQQPNGGGGDNMLLLPDDLFQDIGMSFEMATF